MTDHHRTARLVAQLEDTARKLQQLIHEMDEVLELQDQVDEAAGLTTSDLDPLYQ
jgi:hypothetical protein